MSVVAYKVDGSFVMLELDVYFNGQPTGYETYISSFVGGRRLM